MSRRKEKKNRIHNVFVNCHGLSELRSCAHNAAATANLTNMNFNFCQLIPIP